MKTKVLAILFLLLFTSVSCSTVCPWLKDGLPFCQGEETTE